MPDYQPKQTPKDPDGPDLEDLSRRYVDLWQDQVTALAADPEFAESVQKAMAGLGSAASGLPAAWSAWPAALGSLLAAARPDTVGKEPESHGRKPADRQNVGEGKRVSLQVEVGARGCNKKKKK